MSDYSYGRDNILGLAAQPLAHSGVLEEASEPIAMMIALLAQIRDCVQTKNLPYKRPYLRQARWTQTAAGTTFLVAPSVGLNSIYLTSLVAVATGGATLTLAAAAAGPDTAAPATAALTPALPLAANGVLQLAGSREAPIAVVPAGHSLWAVSATAVVQGWVIYYEDDGSPA